MNKFISFIKRHSTEILTGTALLGLGATVVAVAKETPKAMNDIEENKEDKCKTALVVAKDYAPAIAFGVATAACVVGIGVTSKKKQESIISAYAVCSEMFKEYRNEVVNRYGTEEDEDILNAITQRSCASMCYQDINYPDKKVWFYEPITDQYILCYERKIMDAEYHTNRNFVMRGNATFNEFLEFAGFEIQPYFYNFDGSKKVNEELFGWSMYNGDYFWIDFEHLKTKEIIDGIPVFEIGYAWSYPNEQPYDEMG